MQNKFALIGIALAAAVVIGGGAFFFLNKDKKQTKSESPIIAPSKEKNETAISNNLLGLLNSGETQKCTFSYSDENGDSSGTVYMTGGKLRGDFNITSDENKTSQISMIRVGDDNYIWGQSFPEGTGLKMTLTSQEFSSDEDAKKYFDPTKKVDYKCMSWTKDSSQFTPPDNIKFEDLSEMMKKILPSGSPSSQCSICNSLTGEAKTTCLKSFNCQ